MGRQQVRDAARLALAAVRLFNGAVAVVAPGTMARRLGAEPGHDGVAVYALRMFGIRTVLLAADLVTAQPEVRRHAVRRSVLVHGSDTVAAAALALSGAMPGRTGRLTTAISATNTVLALLSQDRRR